MARKIQPQSNKTYNYLFMLRTQILNVQIRFFHVFYISFKRKGNKTGHLHLHGLDQHNNTTIHAFRNCSKKLIWDRTNKGYQILQQEDCIIITNSFRIKFTERNNHANGPTFILHLIITGYFRYKSKSFPIFQYITNKMQLYTVYLYLETALHVSSGTCTHHQERIQLYLQHLVFDTPLLLPAALRQVAVTVWQIPDALNTVICAPDDGWRYHPKHVEQFPDINKLCKVASCWIYIGTCFG